MKKLIILLCLLLSLNSYAYISVKKTVVIYKKLVHAAGFTYIPHLVLINSDVINAWADETNTVNITKKDLRVLSEPELAHMMGHELAHLKFKDPWHSLPPGSKLFEDRADYWGAVWASKLGYSRCDMAYLFLRFYKDDGNNGGEDDPHSPNLVRFWRLYDGCK